MAKVSTYLFFQRQTEEVFNFYKSVFGTEFIGGIMRFKDTPISNDMPPLPDADKELVMHVSLPILGGHILMGTDTPESRDFSVDAEKNMYINLQPDTREETRLLFEALSKGGKVEMELQEMFWGDYFGSCKDKYGVQWMFTCSSAK
jgi:PhnB protein